MTRYEYKTVPAPRRADSQRGVRDPAERFARTLAAWLNREAAQGWEYVRSETLTVEIRKGLARTRETQQTLLVFRRPAPGPTGGPDEIAPRLMDQRDREPGP